MLTESLQAVGPLHAGLTDTQTHRLTDIQVQGQMPGPSKPRVARLPRGGAWPGGLWDAFVYRRHRAGTEGGNSCSESKMPVG